MDFELSEEQKMFRDSVRGVAETHLAAGALARKQFGRVLAEFQGLQWKFADMKIKLDAGQLLLYRAALNADRGFPSAEETAIAKAFRNQAGFEICSEAMQVMGGMGYTEETLVEYCFRKCRGWMIAGGSIEILKNRIAESVFERTFSQRPPKSGEGVHSFTPSLLHSFTPSLLHSFTLSLLHPLTTDEERSYQHANGLLCSGCPTRCATT